MNETKIELLTRWLLTETPVHLQILDVQTPFELILLRSPFLILQIKALNPTFAETAKALKTVQDIWEHENRQICSQCEGTGLERGYRDDPCDECGGDGWFSDYK